MQTPSFVDNPDIAHGFINGHTYINGQPLKDWEEDFFPDSQFTEKPETFGYCKKCGKALHEHDFWFWCKTLETDEESEGYCVRCLCKLAEAQK